MKNHALVLSVFDHVDCESETRWNEQDYLESAARQLLSHVESKVTIRYRIMNAGYDILALHNLKRVSLLLVSAQ
jgi:RIO-like serine/threonine protein kinase